MAFSKKIKNQKNLSQLALQAETIFKDSMKEEGYRCTRERLTVLREIYESDSHLDADEIFVRLKKKGVSISRATVYHTLDLLFKFHLVNKIDLGHKHTHYEKSYGVANHLHIICEQCDRVVEVHSDELNKLLDRLCEKNGFMLGSFSLQVFAKCREEMDGQCCSKSLNNTKKH
ncbi:transcriptional repressor [Prosthecochloris sp. SCSIO W1101]|uniref:Fur family transcriptional regulator n=1 Tax=Prosthecochloris sp. SCSIO W1101 TaxID=2992242 RepID=UPI00223CA8C7|nr:transcriptional repressor [Prosthecochloris sp. SCSIO W1101]UZJ40531.1 transcriptional repressor [Prosthecochloris sp. SCSIO W1101]